MKPIKFTDTEKHPRSYASAEASKQPGYLARRFAAARALQAKREAERAAIEAQRLAEHEAVDAAIAAEQAVKVTKMKGRSK